LRTYLFRVYIRGSIAYDMLLHIHIHVCVVQRFRISHCIEKQIFRVADGGDLPTCWRVLMCVDMPRCWAASVWARVGLGTCCPVSVCAVLLWQCVGACRSVPCYPQCVLAVLAVLRTSLTDDYMFVLRVTSNVSDPRNPCTGGGQNTST